MQTRLLYGIRNRAAVIISMQAFVHACARTSTDHQIGNTGDVTLPDNAKSVSETNNENEKYDAVTSSTARQSDGDVDAASVDWILLVAFGLIASARHQRSRTVINDLKTSASSTRRPASNREYR